MTPSANDDGAADEAEVFPAWCEDAEDVLDYYGVDDVAEGLSSAQVRVRQAGRGCLPLAACPR